MQNIKTLALLCLGLISNVAHGQTQSDTLLAQDGKHTPSKKKDWSYSNLSRTTFTFWVGATATDISQVDNEGEESSWLQYGMQIGLKEKPIFLSLMYHSRTYRTDYFDDFQSNGFNGDFTFSVKKASLGRVSGRVSRAYLGADLQLGRRGYSHAAQFNFNSTRKEITRKWYTILIRPGFQSSFKWFTFDLALPFGMQTTRHRQTNGFNKSNYTDRTISIFPVAAVGLRF